MITITGIDGQTTWQINVDDSSNLACEIMAVRPLTLNFSLPEHIDIQVGSTTTFLGQTFKLYRKPKVTKINSRNFEYVMEMYGDDYALCIQKIRHAIVAENESHIRVDDGDGRLSFPLTATPKEHLQMIVDNLNLREPSTASGISSKWTVGKCIDWVEEETESISVMVDKGTEKLVSYDNAYLSEALSQLAECFEVEWWVDLSAHTLNLGKMELFKDNPLPVSYGIGNGFKSGVTRVCESELPPVDKLFVQGGNRNIDPTTYGKTATTVNGVTTYSGNGSKTLLLPGKQEGQNASVAFDGETFYKVGSEPSGTPIYDVSDDRMSISRRGNSRSVIVEDSFDGTEIYPQRTGTVTRVDALQRQRTATDGVTQETYYLYDIYDNNLDMVDYSQCSIPTETMTVVFQSGQLAGREFDLNTTENGTVICEQTVYGRRMELCPTTIDDQEMPSQTFPPAVGDKYIVFNCKMPDGYYCNNNTLTGAEWELFKQAVIALHEREKEVFTFTGTMDVIWAKENWSTDYTVGGTTFVGGIGQYMRVGAYLRYSDDVFTSGKDVRITGITYPVNKPKKPTLSLSNALVKTGFSTKVRGLESRNVEVSEAFLERELRFERMEAPVKPNSTTHSFDRHAGAIIPTNQWYAEQVASREEVMAARGGSQSLGNRISSIDGENGTVAGLTVRVTAMDTPSTGTIAVAQATADNAAAEIATARGSSINLNARLTAMDDPTNGSIAQKYTKPSEGIPKTDLVSAVQTSLGKADSAYQKPSGGIPKTDLVSSVQTSIDKADTAYQKPSGGIPNDDLAGGITNSKLAGGITYAKLHQDVKTTLTNADNDHTEIVNARGSSFNSLGGRLDNITQRSDDALGAANQATSELAAAHRQTGDTIAARFSAMDDPTSGSIKTLQTTVGDANSGLVKDVATLQDSSADKDKINEIIANLNALSEVIYDNGGKIQVCDQFICSEYSISFPKRSIDPYQIQNNNQNQTS